MKKLFTILTLVLVVFTVEAETLIDGIYYNLDRTELTAKVTQNPNYYNNYSGSISIPSTVLYEGVSYRVTSIGGSAFYGCTSLTSIEIPNSVTSIGGSAFSGCIGLTSIEIPNSVTSIGDNAFMNCTRLTSVIIGSGVTSIGKDAFKECSKLNKLNISDIAKWCGIIFANDYSNPLNYAHNLYLNNESVTELVIPDVVPSIGNYAFSGCSYLTSVTIPTSVSSIGDGAFYDCYRLNTICCLNPEPPICFSNTFYCSSVVRNAYDVYSYANLHVPMGSGELYAASFDWRYFNKIKEDMQINGDVFYVNLTVQQGTTGFTRQAMKSDERYTLFIGSYGEYKVHSVTFNGEDVTEDVVDGYYTTPAIKKESVLSITYEIATSTNSLILDKVRVTGYNSSINISNIDVPSDISVFSADGKLVETISSAQGSATIRVIPNSLYVVKVGNKTYKLAL